MFGGECSSIEENLSSIFRRRLVQTRSRKTSQVGGSVQIDERAKVCFASIQVGPQQLVKEFTSKDDAQRYSRFMKTHMNPHG